MNKLSVLLVFLLVMCALGLVTSQNRTRKVFVELERAQAQSKQAALLRSQLEVDQSALTKNSLIDGKARRSLAMQTADNERTLHLSLTDPAAQPARTASSGRRP